MTLKTKMSWLDDTGMNRTDSDFVDLLTFDSIEGGIARDDLLIRISTPDIMPFPVGGMKTNWLEPGVPLRQDAPLLGNLPLKPVRLRTIRSQRRIDIAHIGGKQNNFSACIPGDGGKKPHITPLQRNAEERDNPPAFFHLPDQALPKLLWIQKRQVPPADCLTIMHCEQGI